MQGFYVVFEGIDYCGKGTLIPMLLELLGQMPEFAGLMSKLFLVVEPNDQKNRMGKHIRVGLVDRSKRPKDALLFQEQYMIDRYTTMVCDIGPALDDGMFVLGDRSYFSTFAYGSLGVPLDVLDWRHNEILGSVMRLPNVVLLLDVTPEVSIKRLEATGKTLEHFETSKKLTHVRETYLTLMKKSNVVYVPYNDPTTGERLYRVHRQTCEIIDGVGTPQAVLDRVWTTLEPHLREWIAQQR